MFRKIFILAVIFTPLFFGHCYSQTTIPAAPAITIDLGDGVTLEMIKINAAGKTFSMGCQASEQDSDDNEKPAHEVSFKKDYYIGKYEVTQGQWKAIMYEDNPSYFRFGNNYPVEQVSWNEICDKGGFLEKLNTLKPSGYSGFRLPTEAEWEYAARAGSKTRFYWGDDPSYTQIGDHAWYSGNSNSKTHPAGQKLPNKFGLYDMSGNVWEWCGDLYGNYESSAATDPAGPASGPYPVIRGGSQDNPARECRSAARVGNGAANRGHGVGFRLALPAGK